MFLCNTHSNLLSFSTSANVVLKQILLSLFKKWIYYGESQARLISQYHTNYQNINSFLSYLHPTLYFFYMSLFVSSSVIIKTLYFFCVTLSVLSLVIIKTFCFFYLVLSVSLLEFLIVIFYYGQNFCHQSSRVRTFLFLLEVSTNLE